jgi:alkylhydroperoxidase family enzyme
MLKRLLQIGEDMELDSTTRELIADCLARISDGDACAAFDLASTFISYVSEKDIALNLAVIEALVTLAKLQGCADATAFLEGQWPAMEPILQRRWKLVGFK